MSEMVERVAKAADEVLRDFLKYPDDGALRDATLLIARAAIEAMREPTESMLRGVGDGEIVLASTESPASVWSAMIDAALTPPAPSTSSAR